MLIRCSVKIFHLVASDTVEDRLFSAQVRNQEYLKNVSPPFSFTLQRSLKLIQFTRHQLKWVTSTTTRKVCTAP